jgi:hypothetical protein
MPNFYDGLPATDPPERLPCGHPWSALRWSPYMNGLFTNWCSLCEYAAEQEDVTGTAGDAGYNRAIVTRTWPTLPEDDKER